MANPKIEVEIGGSLSKLQKALQDAQAQLQAFGSNVSTKISAFSKSITDAEGKFQKFGESATNAGQALSLGLTAPILAFGTASLKSFGDVQSLKLGLEAVTGSSGEAEKQFARLTEIAKLPGLGLNEAVQGAINLQVIGFTAEKAEKSLQLFGNAVATVGKGKAEFERAIYGLQQLANTDFPLGEDLNILKDAIPQITPLLKEAFGTSRSDDLQKLKISSSQLIDTILIGLEKLPPVAGGINNSFENLGDSIKGSLAGIGESINKTLNVEGFLNKISDTIISLSKSFTELDSATQTIIIVFAGLAAGIGPLLFAIGRIISELPLIIAGFTALTGPIGLISIAIAAAIPLIIALNGELERTGQIKADERLKALNATVEETKVAYKDLAKRFQEKLGISEIDAQKKALETLLQEELNLLNVRGKQNKDVEAIKLRVAAINQLKSELDKVTKSTKGTLDEFSKLAKIENDKVFAKWDLAAYNYNAQLEETIRLQKSIDDISKKIIKDQEPIFIADAGAPIQEKADENPFDSLYAQVEDSKTFVTAFKAVEDQFKAYSGDFIQTVVDFTLNIKEVIQGNLIGAFAGIGDAIGQAFATGENVFSAIGQSLLSSISSFLGDLGQQLIAFGVAGIAFGSLMEAVKKGGPLSIPAGIGAIAAGTALIAISSAIKGRAGKGLSGGGGGGGSVGSGVSGQSFTGGGVGGLGGGSKELTGELVVRGNDLVYVLGQSQNKITKG